MSVITNYFLLYHGKNKIDSVKKYNINTLENKQKFFETLALILVCNRKNYEKFLSLDSFQKALSLLVDVKVDNIESLYQIQICILKILQNEADKEDKKYSYHTLYLLKEEKILSNGEYDKLLSILNSMIVKPKKQISLLVEKKSFLDTKQDLLHFIEKLSVIFDSQPSANALEKVKSYLESQTFSIGVTGVMNAGKSTMLNALMHKELLGTSTIPETANLTIIKHGEPKAEVIYWNRLEWQRVSYQNIAQEVAITDVEKFIQESSLKQVIDIDKLSSYTSANDSQKRYNLVKYVTLYEQLEFLSKEIEIVDTPGIDDPVIEREEISKGYLVKCDLMMHLMNVSQSATQKDISFIIDAILYQNITKLLIVITRADMVTQTQLEEVITYTKSSIQAQLKKQNKASRIDEILDTISFVPISGKMALQHRTGKSKEAKMAGFSLEDTGILKIEAYLQETLFGKDSSKSELIIKSTSRQLKELINKARESLEYTLRLHSKSNEELEQELEDFKQQKVKHLKNLETMQHEIEAYKHEIGLFSGRLEKFLKNELIDMQNVIQERVLSEVRYTYEKSKKRVKSSEIALIIDVGIKDGMVDIMREYRYKLLKKFQTISEIFHKKCEILTHLVQADEYLTDTFEYSSKEFQAEFMTFSNESLIVKITDALNHQKPSRISAFKGEIEPFIKEAFITIEERILEKSKQLSSALVGDFVEQLFTPLKSYEENLKFQEDELLKIISQEHTETQMINTYQKLEQLKQLEEQLVL
jgi:ribosome biogenesis GTPase A